MRHTFLSFLVFVSMLGGCMNRESASDNFSNENIAMLLEEIRSGKSVSSVPTTISHEDINVVGRDGSSPLLWLLMHGENAQNGVQLLMRLGADPHKFSKQLHTSPAVYAVRHTDSSYLSAMISAGMDANHRYDEYLDSPTLLFHAITSGDVAKVKMLSDNGADLEARNASGETPLLYIRLNQYDIALLLLLKGANPRATNKQGHSVCHLITDVPYTPPPNGLDYRKEYIQELEKRNIICTSSGTIKSEKTVSN